MGIIVLFILLLNSFLIFIVHIFILFIYYVISLVCYFYFFFFKSFAICVLVIIVEYMNSLDVLLRYAGWSGPLLSVRAKRTILSLHDSKLVNKTGGVHKYCLPLSCLGSFMYAIEYSVRFASYIPHTNKSIIYVFFFFFSSFDSWRCQTNQASRKLFYFPVYYFSPYQNTVTSVVDWLRSALIPEMAVNTCK